MLKNHFDFKTEFEKIVLLYAFKPQYLKTFPVSEYY